MDEQTTDAPEVGSLLHEATALFGAVSGWAAEHGDEWSAAKAAFSTVSAGHGAQRDEAGGTPHTDHQTDHQADASGRGTGGATEPSTGTWCPVCRAVNTVRHVRPEVRQHLLDAGASLLAAVGELLSTVPPSKTPGSGSESAPGSAHARDGDDNVDAAGQPAAHESDEEQDPAS